MQYRRRLLLPRRLNEATAKAITPLATASTEGVPITSSTSQDATPTIVAAANAFLATLSDTENDTVLFDWTDTAQKQHWFNFPERAFKHTGLMWGDMSETHQNAWLAIMQATLSTEGYNRLIAEWKADDSVAAKVVEMVEGCYSASNTTGSPSLVHHWKPTPGSGNGAGPISQSTPRWMRLGQ